MGTHQNGPAHLIADHDMPLLDLISLNPERFLGAAIRKKWPGTTHIPFLFKILSIVASIPTA